MTVFVDTSGLLAVLDRDDLGHGRAAKAWTEILQSEIMLKTTSYVLVETCALLQHRFGVAAVRFFHEEIVPVMDVVWIDAGIHHAATAIVLATRRKNLSLVDCVSFEIMRLEGIATAFTLDKHFHEQGFTCLPD